MGTWNLIVMAFATTGERKRSLKYSTGRLPGGLVVKNPPCNTGDTCSISGQEDPTGCGATKTKSMSLKY